MGHEVVRGEVGLQTAASELREVRVRRKAEQTLHQVREQRLGQNLLVLPRTLTSEVLAEIPRSVQLAVTAAEAIESGAQASEQLFLARCGGHAVL